VIATVRFMDWYGLYYILYECIPEAGILIIQDIPFMRIMTAITNAKMIPERYSNLIVSNIPIQLWI